MEQPKTARDVLIGIYVQCNRNWDKVFDAIKSKNYELTKETLTSNEYIRLTESDRVLTILDEDYPSCWKSLYHPPFVIIAEVK